MLIFVRIFIVAISLYLWHLTQSLLSCRKSLPKGTTSVSSIRDEVHSLTSALHSKLVMSLKLANIILAFSSAIMDILGIFLFAVAIFGPTFEPVVGVVLLFTLRQFAQYFCHLEPPEGIIWHDPGVPSLFVTYDVKNDLFFSGHTALSVYGALTLHSLLGDQVGIPLGIALVSFQISTVLILRVHYTMDVFTGVFCALYVFQISHGLCTWVDPILYTVISTE